MKRGNRQIDKPGPMDVIPLRRIEFVLAQIVPILPVQQRAHLRHAQIVVGIAKPEHKDRLPAHDNEDDTGKQPDKDDPASPMPDSQIIGLTHHWRSSILPLNRPRH